MVLSINPNAPPVTMSDAIKQKLLKNKRIISIFKDVITKNDGVYFQIGIEPLDPEDETEIPAVVVRLDDAERAEVEVSPAQKPFALPEMNSLYEQFKKSHATYKALLAKAMDTREKLVKQYEGKNYRISLLQLKDKPTGEPAIEPGIASSSKLKHLKKCLFQASQNLDL